MHDISKDPAKLGSVSDLLCQARFRLRDLSEANILSDFLSKTCPNPRLAVIGLTELIVNAIEHGNLGITFEEKSELQLQDNWLEEIDRRLKLPEHREQYVEVIYERLKNEIHITIIDQGKGFNWQQYETNEKQESSKDSHGRGILLAKKLAFKDICYSEKGNEVKCIISIE